MVSAPANLTSREREIVRLVIAGCRNKEIARRLRIGEQSVKNALSTIYAKCHVSNRVQLVTYGLRHGLS
jgi:DNA-binding NarL/FixJ family response regulator